MTTQQAKSRFGEPNETGEGYLEKIILPYPMRIAWDTDLVVKTMRCHMLVKSNFIGVFNDILAAYGPEMIKSLGIDLLGGCFNYRKKRNGAAMSMHSWGIAIDLDPSRNLLKESHRTARFARPEYKKMIDAFYDNGFISLGREFDYDWMHFEIK
jgi:hypothetical protein